MQDKNIIVVGPTSGIGKAVSERLHKQGAKLFGIARHSSSEHLFQHFWEIDVTSEFVLDDLPQVVHGLVYSPGTVNLKPFRSLKNQDFQHDFSTNVLGAIKLLRILEKPLKAGSGSVVLYSTVAVKRGMPFHSSVAASKGAVEGLTRSLAAEWAPEVRVNAIAPSLTDTPLVEKLLNNSEKQKKAAERHPLKRYGTVTDIAALTCHLLSDDGAWITGQVWGADGGLSAI